MGGGQVRVIPWAEGTEVLGLLGTQHFFRDPVPSVAVPSTVGDKLFHAVMCVSQLPGKRLMDLIQTKGALEVPCLGTGL